MHQTHREAAEQQEKAAHTHNQTGNRHSECPREHAYQLGKVAHDQSGRIGVCDVHTQ